MAKYIKRTSDVHIATGHQPLEVTNALEDAGYSPLTPSRYSRYLSLNSANEGALLDVYHPLEEVNFDERVGWSKPDAEELFTHTPAEADYAVSNESMRHTFPKLYAIAMRDFKGMRPSSDRSARSERLVQRARRLGVIEGSEREKSNNVPYQTSPIGNNQNLGSRMMEWEDIPEEEVQLAKDVIRAELGYNRKLSPQFDALQRFEQNYGVPQDSSADPNAMPLPGIE